MISIIMGFNEADWPESETKLTSLAQWRAEIIESILTDGLKPASLLTAKQRRYLGSVDRIPDTGVLGWLLKPAQRLPWQPHQIAADDLRAALYEVSSSSILPVISERPEEEKIYLHNPKEIRAFVERTSTLFLVVCGEDHKGKLLVRYRPRSFVEERQQVLPSSFLYLVFPGSILEEYLNPHFRTGTKFSIPFKATSGVITRHIEGQEVQVLDYESSLNEIMNEVKCPIWVHGVRLPTEGDLARLTPVP